MKHAFFRFGIALALFAAMPAPAHAQFGKLGDAIKKKTKEVGADAIGKEDPKKDESTSSAKPSSQMPITAEVLENFTKGLNAESAKRSIYVKRQECAQSSVQSLEYMHILAAEGEAMGKQLNDNMTDAQKSAAMMKAGEEMQKNQTAWLVKKCGPDVGQMDASTLEAAGAETAGFTQVQYGLLKERITVYCDAVAHSSDTPSNSRMVFTADEMATLKPRCGALLQTLKKNT